MMKLFQHVNIQPCLAAFAADMEVGSVQVIDPPEEDLHNPLECTGVTLDII